MICILIYLEGLTLEITPFQSRKQLVIRRRDKLNIDIPSRVSSTIRDTDLSSF